VRLPGQVIYELHIGTFTPEGTFDAAAESCATCASSASR
jgi:maltooligosyltrehalose trehalohydrolase